MKKIAVSRKHQGTQRQAGTGYHIPVRRTGWRNGCQYALSLPALRDSYREVAGLLTDIGSEELAHLEMVAAIVHQLTRNLSMEEIEKAASHPTTRTTPLASGRRQQAVFLSMPANSKVKEMSLPTFLKTWLQSKKQEPLTTTFFA